ncbi:MAG TPA: hypothetical protein PK089_00055 [Methanoregulaceae archaeon]|nr:hypothetical protein [Methanoregulaceae archaeon]HQJ88578.1 hypothetical protein [Methanoregulaceae archaeon]
MTPVDPDPIRTLQEAVLRRCEERIARAGRTAAGCYHEAARRTATGGFTGGMRARYGL